VTHQSKTHQTHREHICVSNSQKVFVLLVDAQVYA
jgi:hypothetical protein